MKVYTYKDIELRIGSNALDNESLFNNANDDDTWFHVYSFPSAHMWMNGTIPENKNTLYQIALQLKKKSKYKKISGLPIIYTTKKNLTKTETPGTFWISGKSHIITV